MSDFLRLMLVLGVGVAFVVVTLIVIEHQVRKHQKRAEYSKPLALYPHMVTPEPLESVDTHAMDLGQPHVVRSNETGTWGFWFFTYCTECGMREGKSCPCPSRKPTMRKLSNPHTNGVV